MRDHWSTTALDNNSFYGNIMSRNRFDAIYHTMLHVGKMGAAGKAKIEPFLSKLVTEFQCAFYPFKSLAIDETVVGWKGSCKYKQYNAAKQKSHIRTFGLCVSVTGYVHNLLTYFDKKTSFLPLDATAGQAEKVFHTLLNNIDTVHHIFTDRYYTTRKLVDYMLGRNLHFTRTLIVNRKNVVPELKTLKLKHRKQKRF